MRNEQTMDKCAQVSHGLSSVGNASREITLREMIRERADSLRKEAFRLEAMANEFPEGSMSPEAEETLRRLVVNGIYR